MTDPTVSVIIVSRKRPELLRRCLLGVSQLYYSSFEVVVVADQIGLDAIANSGCSGKTKTALCDIANISIARNMGLKLASADLVAFLDDDSVPEPSWLTHLSKAFKDPSVHAAGGYVLGRNGISFSTKAQMIDTFGVTSAIELESAETVIMTGTELEAVSTEGTNCAFRRILFEDIGVFDTGFSYFLDESDMNMRIAKAGYNTAIVPLAQVHHSVGKSERRHADQMPTSLFQIGQSTALFLRKHCKAEKAAQGWQGILQRQRRRLIEHTVVGNCEPKQIRKLIATLEEGFRSGQKAPMVKPVLLTPPEKKFLKYPKEKNRREHLVITSNWLSRRKARLKASTMVSTGRVVSLFLFSRTSLYHCVRFHPDGYWEQWGGVFGRSVRKGSVFQWYSLQKRALIETERLALVRLP